MLFVIFINDLPDAITGFAKMFADDTKLFRSIANTADCILMQEDINMLDEWSRTWQLRFNASKCKHMRLGTSYREETTYTMTDVVSQNPSNLDMTTTEKDLGVHVDHQMKFAHHINTAVKKGNSILGIVRRTFTYMDKHMALTLYKALIRPHLEYGNVVWYPQFAKDINAIEGVQRRATKLIPSLKDLTYKERLQELKLPTLVHRRMRGDMIDTYKFLSGKYNVATDMFTLAGYQGTRGHSLKLDKPTAKRLDIRRNFFSHRVVNTWNSLPEEVVSAPTVNAFKNRLDRAWKDHPNLYDFEHKNPPGCAPVRFRLTEAISIQDSDEG